MEFGVENLLEMSTLRREAGILSNDISYYFSFNPPGNILHGKINMRFEKELRDLLKIV